MKSLNKMESMAFDEEIATKKEDGISMKSLSDFQNTTISVSTVMMLIGGMLMVFMMRSCFWKEYGVKKENQIGQAMYGAI